MGTGQCRACGADIPAGTTACPGCGALLLEETSTAAHRERAAGPETARSGPETAHTNSPEKSVTDTTTERTDTGGGPTTGGRSLAGRFWLNTLISTTLGFAFALVIASAFFPLYVLGIMAGAFAGGLFHERGVGSGALVGAMSGFLGTLPFVGMLLVVALAGIGGLLASGEPLMMELLVQEEVLVTVGVITLVLVGSVFVGNVVCGLIGGALGGAMADE